MSSCPHLTPPLSLTSSLQGAVRGIRFITTECFVWAHVRKVFGKPLISQPVIRQKLAAVRIHLDIPTMPS